LFYLLSHTAKRDSAIAHPFGERRSVKYIHIIPSPPSSLQSIDNRRKIGGRNRAKDKIINQTVFFCTAVMGTIVSSIASTSRMLTMRLRVFVFVILSFSPSKLF